MRHSRVAVSRVVCLLVVAAAMPFAVAPGVGIAKDGTGDEGYDCGLVGVGAGGEHACVEPEGVGNASPASCRTDAEGVFWTGTDWVRLAQALAADRSPCADYWISIPPLAANKRGLRVLQDDVIRRLGLHPIAEFALGGETGWANWVKNKGKTWFEAGVEFRRAMALAGYGGPDETWLVNEFDRSTQRDAAAREVPPEPDVPAYRRADMVKLLEGLYYGDPGMPPLRGAVEIGINFRHQNIPNVAQYKQELKAWLMDGPFWSNVTPYIRWLTVENYPDVRNWGVPGSSRDERRRHLEDYLFHTLELVRAGGPDVRAARDLFERTFLPLANAGYRARGGDQFQFVTGHGNTVVDGATMQHFVSEQVYAIRHYAGAHPQGAPAGRLGFSWQPCNRTTAQQAACDRVDAAFVADLDVITGRIASAIHYAYRQGGASPAGACSPPASHETWCHGEVSSAAFTDAWESFSDWSD